MKVQILKNAEEENMEILINPKKKKKGKKKKSKRNPVENAVLKSLSGNPSNPTVLVNPKIVLGNPRKSKKKKRKARRNPGLLRNLTKRDNLIWIGTGFGANWFIGDKLPDLENIPFIGQFISKIPNGKKVLIPAGGFVGSFFVKGKMKRNLQNFAIGSGIDYIFETFILKKGQMSGLPMEKRLELIPPSRGGGTGESSPESQISYEEIPYYGRIGLKHPFFEKLKRF
jgi:hypothetical protein